MEYYTTEPRESSQMRIVVRFIGGKSFGPGRESHRVQERACLALGEMPGCLNELRVSRYRFHRAYLCSSVVQSLSPPQMLALARCQRPS